MARDDKSYTFRNIPNDVHSLWKTCAALKGVSMLDFAVDAIKNAGIEYMRKRAQELKLSTSAVNKIT